MKRLRGRIVYSTTWAVMDHVAKKDPLRYVKSPHRKVFAFIFC